MPGTSLAVAPFSGLVAKVGINVPRVLLNREAVGLCEDLLGGFRFHRPGSNHRDVFCEGSVDAGVERLASALGWAEELRAVASGAAAAGAIS
mmetsp:Transcript_57209/g.158425  ORF Transcript_57209/g.158425 Transcript_57209/m.158425 type:complete len:92 (+) Transcript_57209:681-956(+)